MAYSENKDLIQNVKDLSSLVDSLSSEFNQVQPSITQILELKEEFEGLAESTTSVIQTYEGTLRARDADYSALIEECRSQFKQVTDDVEALVNLEVNFEDIKGKIIQCIALSDHINNLVKGPFVLMDGDAHYVEVEDRIPYKHYLKVIDSIDIGGGSGGSSQTVRVSPSMAFSYTAP